MEGNWLLVWSFMTLSHSLLPKVSFLLYKAEGSSNLKESFWSYCTKFVEIYEKEWKLLSSTLERKPWYWLSFLGRLFRTEYDAPRLSWFLLEKVRSKQEKGKCRVRVQREEGLLECSLSWRNFRIYLLPLRASLVSHTLSSRKFN